ncbi:MAG: septal ring lytic transglycosylase RlpA family protein [Verrucomicrobia bacterium]|nr:septal ring lytic transglycosylase RlpA family protein [Verrucomicrobiota bacterium]
MIFRCILGAVALLLISCARPSYQEQGWASCIADEYAGRPTTSGQPYYPQAFTAAHTSLPFGTQCEVTNLQTGRQVTVVVNDRFPYYPGRVINLSRAAAQYIGLPYSRLCQVRVKSFPPSGGGYRPQPAYQPQPMYQQQPAYQQQPMYQQQPPYQQPQQSYARAPTKTQPSAPKYTAPKPTYTAPKYTAPSYTAPKPSYSPGAPNAPSFSGGGPPPGLKTF